MTEVFLQVQNWLGEEKMLLPNELCAWRAVTLVQSLGELACVQLCGVRLGCVAPCVPPSEGGCWVQSMPLSQRGGCLRSERHRGFNELAGSAASFPVCCVFPMDVTIKAYAPSHAARRWVYSPPGSLLASARMGKLTESVSQILKVQDLL